MRYPGGAARADASGRPGRVQAGKGAMLHPISGPYPAQSSGPAGGRGAAAALPGWAWLVGDYYRLTVGVETPEGSKTGSCGIDVRAAVADPNKHSRLGAVMHRVCGEAVCAARRWPSISAYAAPSSPCHAPVSMSASAGCAMSCFVLRLPGARSGTARGHGRSAATPPTRPGRSPMQAMGGIAPLAHAGRFSQHRGPRKVDPDDPAAFARARRRKALPHKARMIRNRKRAAVGRTCQAFQALQGAHADPGAIPGGDCRAFPRRRPFDDARNSPLNSARACPRPGGMVPGASSVRSSLAVRGRFPAIARSDNPAR